MKAHRRAILLLSLALFGGLATAPLRADDKFWNSFFDGSFNDASKWTGGVPGMDDVAHFGRTTNPMVQQANYTVDFDVSPTNQRFLIEDDFVIFSLNGRTYSTTLVAGGEIGNVAGRTGRLTVMEGTLALGTNSLFEVGAVANASGFFTVTTGAIVNGTPFLAIGETGSGTLTVLNGGRVNAGLFMLGSSGTATGTASITGANTILDIASGGTTSVGAASGTTDMLTVQSGGTFSSGTGAITVGATGTVAILGGTFNATGDMTVNGLVIRDSGGAFNLVTGKTLTVQNGGVVSITGTFIQPNSATITITGADAMFSVTSILEFEGDSIINVLAGGSLSAGTAPIFLGQASSPTVNVDGSGSTFSGGNLFLGVMGGTLTFTNGSSGTFGTLSVADSTFQGSSGVLSIQSGATVSAAGLSVATAAVPHTGTATVTGAGSALTFTGAATTTIGAGNSSTATVIVENGGTFTTGTGQTTVNATGTLNITSMGTLTGPSDFAGVGAITLAGTYLPGAPSGANQTTSASFAQNIALQGTTSITMELAGLTAGTNYDQIVFNGPGNPQITWNGMLNVVLVSGFMPQAGDMFDLFDFDAARAVGAFTAINLPALSPGLFWDTDRLYLDGTIEVSAGPTPMSVSRKMHGAVNFDINLPLTGTAGIECRNGGAGGDHQIIVIFPSSVTVSTVSVSSGTGSVSSFNVNGAEVTVNLTGVSNAQTIVTTLFGVNNGTSTSDVPVPMGVLLGDTSANATVNASDISQTKSRLGQAITNVNFRSDINRNGAINASDVSLIKSQVGTSIP